MKENRIKRVFIPTAGIGSRLGELTMVFNKCMLPYRGRPAIHAIIQAYPGECEFIIALGYGGDIVMDYLITVFPDKKFKFIFIKKYDPSEGGSLLETLYQCREHFNQPFIFHAADSITPRGFNVNSKHNVILTSEKLNIDKYTKLTVGKSKVKEIKVDRYDIDTYMIGVYSIIDYKKFVKGINYNYKHITNTSDTAVLDYMMNKKCKFEYLHIGTGFWVDYGDPIQVEKHMKDNVLGLNTLPKKNQMIYRYKDQIIKVFSEPWKSRKLYETYKVLKPSGLMVDVVNYSKYTFITKYAPGITLRKHLEGNLNDISFYNVLEKFHADNIIKSTPKQKREFVEKFYIEKTRNRVAEFLRTDPVNDIVLDDKFSINGIEIDSITDLLDRLFEYLRTMDLFNVTCGKVHGDLVLDNIIINGNDIKFIDWREETIEGVHGYGDQVYDIAKLLHSCCFDHNNFNDSHLLLVKNQHVIVQMVGHNSKLMNILDNLPLKYLHILVGLIWLNMSPLHGREYGRYLFFAGLHRIAFWLNEDDE